MGPQLMGTGQDRDRDSGDRESLYRDGSGMADCGNVQEQEWRASPMQHLI